MRDTGRVLMWKHNYYSRMWDMGRLEGQTRDMNNEGVRCSLHGSLVLITFQCCNQGLLGAVSRPLSYAHDFLMHASVPTCQ